jgi:N utilization substance protein B
MSAIEMIQPHKKSADGSPQKSREIALQGLYKQDTVGTDAVPLRLIWWMMNRRRNQPFARVLIRGTLEHIEEADALFRSSAELEYDRIDSIDKSILRMSIFAMLHLPEIPQPVTINEAIELGKIYGGENSAQFVNGILDAIHKSKTGG